MRSRSDWEALSRDPMSARWPFHFLLMSLVGLQYHKYEKHIPLAFIPRCHFSSAGQMKPV